MSDEKFPALDPAKLDVTRRAIHAYSRVAGAWAKATRKKRKHWWHASLRPSLYGLTTGTIYGATDFEIELDLAASRICVRTCTSAFTERLTGQSSAQVAAVIRNALLAAGVDKELMPSNDIADDDEHAGYSADQANLMHRAIGSVAAALEEYADKQMNFGFAFGDESIPEPYFYVTAYPLPDALPEVALPEGSIWKSDGFSGALLLYRDLVAMNDPAACLQDLWSTLLAAGQTHLAINE